MRLYLEHRKYYLRYLEAQKKVEAILNEYEIISQKVQPKNSLAEHEREFSKEVNLPASGQKVSKVDEYVIAMEQRKIRKRLDDAKLILKERKELLDIKEQELRKSRDIYNRIYTLKWVDGIKVDSIIEETGYSRSQVYSIIKRLHKQLERSE